MNNLRVLKLTILTLIVALLVSLGLLRSAKLSVDKWRNKVQGTADAAGMVQARDDYLAGKRRLYVSAGANNIPRYSGSNDGPFEIWIPVWYPSPEPVRFSLETKWKAYNL